MNKMPNKTQNKMQKKISKNMTFAEVLQKYPKTAPVFMKHGMTCIGCPFAAMETIEQGAKAHEINTKKLIDELNKIIKQKKKK